ncbi:MAG: hypothetical protein ACI3Y4_03775 [Candidatus Cryptobacteroides sp.]
MIDIGFGILAIIITFGFAWIMASIDLRKKEREKERIKKEQEEKIRELNQSVKDGKWEFPAEEYYCLCRDNQATMLNNEFGIRKATQLAEQLIKQTAPDVDLSNCGEYLKKSSLESFLEKGEALAKKTEEQMLLAQKQPRNANPIEPETTFLQRASELAALSGSSKRVKMLSNLDSDYFSEIVRKINGEQALGQLGMIYAGQQKKESSWAIMGGIAEGIAGPGAGIMAASQTIANNRKIQEHNAAMRKASMDIMSGIPSMVGDKEKLYKEREKVKQALKETESKVVLSKPTSEEIWKNITVGKAAVQKKPSGVLSVSVPVSLKEPFTLDVPENVRMVVDGVLRGEVWFEDKWVDNVYFPFPMYGIPSNITAETILDGMCGRSVEYEGEYTVKIADTQNLWIMEA